ncbi:MAG: DUF3035 domain-containing protein [Alphaproteobacteria bacterium]
MSRKYLAVLFLPLALGACGETRETLGLGHVTPDEFAVVDRPPLVMPPDYNLRPPQPGAPRPQEVAAVKQAEQTVFGAKSNDASAKTSSWAADSSDLTKEILAKAGADRAMPDIRGTIDRESAQRVSGDRHLVESLLWWRKDSTGGAAVVDATVESQRLRANQQAGKPANAGATPVIEKRRTSWLGL